MSATQETRQLRRGRCKDEIQLTADEPIAAYRTEWPRCCMSPLIWDFAEPSVRANEGTEVERTSRRSRRVFAS